jgi:hypothetical protein
MKLKKCTILRIVPIQRVAETDRRLDKRFEETDKAIKKLTTLFTGQWAGGELIEAPVKPTALKLFPERGVNVTKTYPRVERSQHT